MVSGPTDSSSDQYLPDAFSISVAAVGKAVRLEVNNTSWVDQAPGDDCELRELCPGADLRWWKLFKERWTLVDSTSTLGRFARIGGHCAMSAEIFRRWWPDLEKPMRCHRYTEGLPFLARDYMAPGYDARFPVPVVKGRIYTRDGGRCQMCGADPQDHSAVRLEVHHVVGVADAGPTVEENLITLCKGCHDVATADASLAVGLFDRIAVASGRMHRDIHIIGVADYRKLMRGRLRPDPAGDAMPAEPFEFLDRTDLDDVARYRKWDLAYKLMVANSVILYIDRAEWLRRVPRAERRA